MILNVYKEKGWTSFDVVKKLKSALKLKKIGHAGTLDPLAEGVLVILTDTDTKKQSEIMKLEKEYVASVAFGASSESYDLEQPLTYSRYGKRMKDLDQTEIYQKLDSLHKKIQQTTPHFVGEKKQKVPPHSAVKVGGKPLYKKARKGKINLEEIPEKDVLVYDIHFQNLEFNNDLKLPIATFIITCGKGYYVRSFAHDLGKVLQTEGVLVDLVRTRVGDYTVAESNPISSFLTAT